MRKICLQGKNTIKHYTLFITTLKCTKVPCLIFLGGSG